MSEKLRTKTSKIWEFIFWNTSIHIWVFIKIFCVISVWCVHSCGVCVYVCVHVCLWHCILNTSYLEPGSLIYCCVFQATCELLGKCVSVSHLTTVARDHYTWLYVGSQNLNSCPQVCAASVLFNSSCIVLYTLGLGMLNRSSIPALDCL